MAIIVENLGNIVSVETGESEPLITYTPETIEDFEALMNMTDSERAALVEGI